MKFDPEIIRAELEQLRSRYTFSRDPETGEITTEGDVSELPAELQALLKIMEEIPEFEDDWEPTPAEQELAEDSENAWEELERNMLRSLEVFEKKDEENLYPAFQELCHVLNELWWSEIYVRDTQLVIFRFMKDIDPEFLEEVQPRLWFRMYSNTDHEKVKNDLIDFILQNGKEPDFPYAGYYTE